MVETLVASQFHMVNKKTEYIVKKIQGNIQNTKDRVTIGKRSVFLL